MKGVTDWIGTGINVVFYAALALWADSLTITSDTGLRRTSFRLVVVGSIPFLLGLGAFRFLPSFVRWLDLPENEPSVQTGDLLAFPVLIVTFIGGLLAAVGLGAEVLRKMRKHDSR